MNDWNVARLMERVRQRPLTAAWVAAIATVLVVMYAGVGAVFVHRWFSDSSQYHCVVVPFLVGWFVWRRWPELTAMSHRPSLAGFALLAFGLAMYWASARTGTRLLAGAALPVILSGIVAAVYGGRAFLLTAAPLALLIFAVPIPEHAVGMLAMPMQRVSAVITGALAPLLGLNVIQQGVNLDLNGFVFVVAEECSGMRSLIALLLTGFVLIEISSLPLRLRTVGVAIIPFLVLFANVTRLLFVLLLGEYFGPQFALGVVVHGVSDVVVYGSAVLALILIIGWFHDLKPTDAAPAAAQPSSEAAKAVVHEVEAPSADGGIIFGTMRGGTGDDLSVGVGGD
ncbi:MAG TPA: hypothetical protein DEP45_10385 [Armatimonadetes bacterium]|nr:hypothetical protein [Armatimonadota bacterium]